MDFQLIDDPWLTKNKPWLFKKGTKLFVDGDSGEQAIHIKSGHTLQLELAGAALGPVTVRSSDHNVTVTGPDARNRIAVTSNAAVTTLLTAHDSTGRITKDNLWVSFGKVEKHSGMEVDLIADLLSEPDPVRIHAMHRFLNDNPDNVFNENWQGNIDKWGPRACGTVAKAGGHAFWESNPEDHLFRAYHIPFPVPRGRSSVRVTDRKQVKFKEDTVNKGKTAILGWLTRKKKPVLVGVLYGPTTGGFLDTGTYGTIQRGGRFGHTVMIVGCDKAAENFLYIDPWHGGSQLIYGGGITAASKFTRKCSMGILSLDRSDLATRGPVLRQTLATEGTFERKGGDFLEVISGP